jgi:hypothetical protein
VIRGSRCDCGGTFVGRVDADGSFTVCDGCGFGMREYPPPAKRSTERARLDAWFAGRPSADAESQAFFALFVAGGDPS